MQEAEIERQDRAAAAAAAAGELFPPLSSDSRRGRGGKTLARSGRESELSKTPTTDSRNWEDGGERIRKRERERKSNSVALQRI